MSDQDFFEELGNTTPFFKFAAQGMAGSGKTFTLAQIIIGLHKRIESEKPVIIFDTENSAKFLTPMFAAAGIKVLVKTSRTLPDLSKTLKLAENGAADIVLIDSITHVYEQFLEDFKQRKNRKFIQFQDWGFLKPVWKREFSTRFVDAKCHVGFTGRQGYTYDYEEIDGKRELVKTGVKMKAEAETAYEPDMLLHMERYERLLGDNKEVWREAMVLKDRSDILDGRIFKDPSYEDLAPAVEFILSDPIDRVMTLSHSNDDILADADEQQSDLQERKAMLERNHVELDTVAAGTSADAKKLRLALIADAYYGEVSETAIARMNLGQLTEANQKLHKKCRVIKRIVELEALIYSKPKEIAAVREEYLINSDGLPTGNLGEVSTEDLTQYGLHLKGQYDAAQTGSPRVWTLDDLKGLWKDRGAGLSEEDRQQCEYDIAHPVPLTEAAIADWCKKLSGE